MSRLVLIDGNAVIHRAFHALPTTLTNSVGELTNAVYGFTSMLLQVIETLKPTHMTVCFDRKEPTFRKEIFKDYQSHRPEMDQDLSSQFGKTREVIESFGIPIYDKAGFEADDVIGTIAKKAKVDEVVIVTGDKDILQLISKKVKVYLIIKGVSNGELVDAKKCKEMLGVTPAQIVDYKALMGDSSDNYPGVRGIGPKTARALLEKYDTLNGVYGHLGDISDSVKQKLEKYKKDAYLSQKLAKILTNVKVQFDLKDADDWGLGREETMTVFTSLNFRSLKSRVKKLADKMGHTAQMRLL